MVDVILRIIFYALLFGIIYYAVKGLFGGVRGPRGDAKGGADEPPGNTMIACPECDTYFPVDIGVPGRVRGKKFMFCGVECAQGFRARGGPPGDETSKDQDEG